MFVSNRDETANAELLTSGGVSTLKYAVVSVVRYVVVSNSEAEKVT